MHHFIILLTLLFLDTASASMQYPNDALSACLDENVELSDKLTHYIDLLNGTSQANHYQHKICEDNIMDSIFNSLQKKEGYLDQQEYLEKLSVVNEIAQEHPSHMCILGVAIRSEWEAKYLNPLNREYFQEHRTQNNLIDHMYTFGTLPLLAFAGTNSNKISNGIIGPMNKIANKTRLGKIARLIMTMGLVGYLAEETFTNQDLLMLRQNRFSIPNVPTDPVFVLDCPVATSIKDESKEGSSIEVTNIYALGEMLEREVQAELASMGISSTTLGAVKMIQRARTIKNVSTATKVARGGLVIAGVSGPQIVLFGAGLLAYEGLEAVVEHYLDNKKQNNLETELKEKINELDTLVHDLKSSLSQMPDNFYSLPLNTSLASEREKISEELERVYILSREVMEDVYNLVGFYNAPILKKSMELRDELSDTNNISNDSKLRREINKIYDDIAQLNIGQTECMPGKVKESYRYDITRTSLIDKLKTEGLDGSLSNVIKNITQKGTSILDLVDQSIASEIPVFNEQYIDHIVHYEAGLIETRKRSVIEILRSEGPNALEKYTPYSQDTVGYFNRVLNHSTLAILEADAQESQKAWYDSFRQGNFCRDSNSLLYQLAQYFEYLHFVMTSLYKNKATVGFFAPFSTNLRVHINKSNSFYEMTRDNHKVISQEQRNTRHHGGVL